MPADPVDEIFAAFAARGQGRYGEDVSQLEHALQCAWLAEREGAGEPLIAAALLHDYGHLLEGHDDVAAREGVDARHERIGAHALRRWFGADVVGPIALHVAAKRYLCAAEPEYEAQLSAASVHSLALQGGRLTLDAQRRFARGRHARDAVRLRRWDDAGKIVGLGPPGLEHYRPLLRRVAGA